MPSRLVVISGASSGIGLATARRFAAAGDQVVNLDANAPAAGDGAGEWVARLAPLPLLELRLTVASLVLLPGELAFLAIGSTVAGMLLWNRAVLSGGTARVSLLLYLVPVVSVLASAVFLGERVTPVTVASGLLILVGVAAASTGRNRRCPDRRRRSRRGTSCGQSARNRPALEPGAAGAVEYPRPGRGAEPVAEAGDQPGPVVHQAEAQLPQHGDVGCPVLEQ
jgi:hypothetical protein